MEQGEKNNQNNSPHTSNLEAAISTHPGEIYILNEYKFLYEWKFQSTEEEAEIIFSFPPTFNSRSLSIKLNEAKTGITVELPDMIPFVTGKLFEEVEGYDTTSTNNSFIISFRKKTSNEWPILITDIHPDTHRIDPQSAFVLSEYFRQSDQDSNKELSLKLLFESASCGYLPAMRLFSTLFISNAELSKEALNMIVRGASFYNDPMLTLNYAVILSASDDPNVRTSSINYFHAAANMGVVIARSYIGQMISPLSEYPFQIKNATKAAEIFEKVLEESPNECIACHELAKLLYNGVGVPLDEQRAEELQKRALENNPEVPPLEKLSKSKLAEIKKMELNSAVEGNANTTLNTVKADDNEIGIGDILLTTFSIVGVLAIGCFAFYKYYKRQH